MSIDVDNENCIMTEATSKHNVYDYFNFVFMDFAQGSNKLVITGNADILIYGRLLYNVGA